MTDQSVFITFSGTNKGNGGDIEITVRKSQVSESPTITTGNYESE